MASSSSAGNGFPRRGARAAVARVGEVTRRACPCRRCLHAMATWVDGDLPNCEDDESASMKCLHCRINNKECGAPVGVLKARGTRLYAALTADPVELPVVRAEQVGVRKALQAAKNRKNMAPEKVAAADAADIEEREERRTLAMESLARDTHRLAGAVEALLGHYETVHQNAINGVGEEESEEDEVMVVH